MANNYFQFKQFIIHQDRCAMKVTTDSCLFGAWVAEEARSLDPVAIAPEGRSVLDIGAGTGLLSMMIAQKNNLTIDAIEIDNDAFLQTSENIAASPWGERIKIFYDNVKNFDPPCKYDIIISNPPFYENEWLSESLQRNTAHHSSELLLADLLAIIADWLKPGGRFYLLLPYKRQEEIMKLFDHRKIYLARKILVRQSGEHAYFRIMIDGRFERPADPITKELSIKNKNNEYTEEFTTLLKDYYLYM